MTVSDARQIFIDAERGSAVVAVLHGDIHIRNGSPVYQVTSFPAKARQISPERARQQPSRLLAAECQTVPFSGRERQLAELASWRDAPAPGVAVRLVCGPGGQGKTRLAARFAAESGAAGWMAWAAHHLSDPTGQHIVAPGDPGPNLVLIVDYADRWPVDDLLLLLANPLLRHPRRARVLLVARSPDRWWASVGHRLSRTGIEVGSVTHVPTLADTALARRKAFVSARDSFADVFGIPSSPIPAPEMMDGDAFRLVLTIHMAALVAVDACWRRAEPPRDPVGLSAYLLDREHDAWHALRDHEQITTTPDVMGRAVYTATLTRQLHRNLAQAALQRTGVTDAGAVAEALDDHAVCYPPADPETGTWLEPLYPDRLGEDFIALTTPGHMLPDYPAEPWAARAPARLLALDGGDSPPYTRPVATVLIETARRWPHIVRSELNPLLREWPQIAVNAGGSALTGLADLPGVDRDVLEAVESKLPDHRHLDLDIGIAALTARLTSLRLAETDDASVQAILYHTLGKRFANAGLTEDALTATSKAVEIRQRLVAERPGTCEPDLALSLTNLGKVLSDRSDHERALAVTNRAVDVYRQLARTSQAPDQAGLARALNNRAAVLSVLGRPKEALAAIEEATRIRGGLAESDPAAHEPDLALTVNNLAVILRSLGLREQALTASGSAADIWLRLAADNPAAHLPDLARALNNFAADLADMGRSEDAMRVAGQAVDVHRQLTQSNRVAHEPGLAMALRNRAARLSAAGRSEEAMTAIQEAAEIAHRLAAQNKVAFEPALAGTLDKHGVILANAGRLPDALAAIENAVRIRQRLAANNPAAYEPALAESLNNLGKVLFDSERNKEAMAITKRAVTLYRRLADADPDAHEPGLAMALGNLGTSLICSRHRQQALAVTGESVSIYRRLAVTNGAAHEADLAAALYRFAFVRSVVRKDSPAALNAVMEAIQILERLTAREADAFAELLLAAYAAAAEILEQLGSKQEATAIRRLVEQSSARRGKISS